jgi:PAS domain-containing protein
MQYPDIPPDDDYRVDALHALALLDSDPDPDFDAVVAIGRRLFGVPTCLVTLVDRDRQWFKARAGLDVAETSRMVSFCGHAILRPEVLVVPDARRDDRFHDNPLVIGEPFIRFYAGAPIRLPNGYTIGTVCVLSPDPRENLSAEDRGLLEGLADLALSAITVRAMRRELDGERRERGRFLRLLETIDRPVALLEPDGTLRTVNAAFESICVGYPSPGLPLSAVTSLTPDDFDPAGFDPSGVRRATVRTAVAEQDVTLHRDDDGYILVGSLSSDRSRS